MRERNKYLYIHFNIQRTMNDSIREQKMKNIRDEKVRETYGALLEELKKNLRLQRENPGKIVSTSFYFYDFWAEYADHDAASNIFIGNIPKTPKEELDELLNIKINEPYLKFDNTVYTFRPDGVAEYERLKKHPYYSEFVEVQEDDDSWESNGGKIITYAINCGQDVEHAAEVLTILYVDVLRINPFFFAGVDRDSGVPPFVTVVVDVRNKENLSWEEAVRAVGDEIDDEPLFACFRKG